MAAKYSVHDRFQMPCQADQTAPHQRRPNGVRRIPVKIEDKVDFDKRDVEGRAASVACGGVLQPIDWTEVDKLEEAIRLKHSKGVEA